MIFKGFRFGKSKDKAKENLEINDETTTPIAELEEQLKERTNNLKQTEKKLSRLSDKVNGMVDMADAPVRHHKPIKELSIAPEDNLEGPVLDEDILTDDITEERAEEIKLVEAQVESEPVPLTKRETKNKLDSESLKALFTSVEEDVNPLANLINSLPDVTIDELEEDLKEIKDIIKDWQKK